MTLVQEMQWFPEIINCDSDGMSTMPANQPSVLGPSSQSLMLEYIAPDIRTRKRRRTASEKDGTHGRR